jgi:hypothetical protein
MINTELTYRLELLRTLDRAVREASNTQERIANNSFGKAMAWGHESLIKLAREAIDELGPLSKIAQEAEVKDFIESLDQ